MNCYRWKVVVLGYWNAIFTSFAEIEYRFSDKEILPGRQLPPECHAELHTDYGGVAVRWGLTHHKESAYDCCMACLDQAKHAKPGQKRCNIWVYCPSENGCYSPDIYEHKNQECWLKYVSSFSRNLPWNLFISVKIKSLGSSQIHLFASFSAVRDTKIEFQG